MTLAATPVFSVNKAPRWALYYLSNTQQAASSMFWAWTQDTLSGDPATRAFASAGLNVWAWTCQATVPLGVFQVVNQPAVVAGNWTASGFSLLAVVASLTLAWLQSRRKKDFEEDSDAAPVNEITDGSSEGDVEDVRSKDTKTTGKATGL